MNQIFAGGLHQPFGIAFYPLGPNPEWIYVANSNSVVRFPYKSGDVKAGRLPSRSSAASPRRTITRATSASLRTAAACC